MIVFGSEYRTAPRHGQARHARPTNCCSAVRRRSPSPRPGCARTPRSSINTVGVHRRGRPQLPGRPPTASPPRSAPASPSTASGPVDFLVVGSRPEAPAGKVTLSAASDYAVEAANYPVLVTPRGVSLGFTATQAPGDLTTRITAVTSGSRPSIRSRRVGPADRQRVLTVAHGLQRGLERVRRDRSGGEAPGRRPRPPRAAVGSRPRRQRCAFDQPWPKARSGRLHPRALEDGQPALARVPLAVADLDRRCRRPRARARSARRSASSRLKTRACWWPLLISTWKGMAPNVSRFAMMGRWSQVPPSGCRRLRQRRPAARHRVGLDPGRAGPLRAPRRRPSPRPTSASWSAPRPRSPAGFWKSGWVSRGGPRS